MWRWTLVFVVRTVAIWNVLKCLMNGFDLNKKCSNQMSKCIRISMGQKEVANHVGWPRPTVVAY